MTQIELTSDLDIELIDYMGKDLTVVNAARVSLNQHSEEMTEKDAGLIKFLMKNRHACYDSNTEVLTSEGWKKWPSINGTETFITLNLKTNEIELQKPTAVIHEAYTGKMVKMSMNHVDALVTPNHRMVSSPRTKSNKMKFGLNEASEFFSRSYRLKLGGGEWNGELHCPELAELIGFIAADGHVTETSISFSLVKVEKIDWLISRAKVSISKHSNPSARTYRILEACEQLKLWAKETYTETRDRCLPRELLQYADQETLQALLDGYLIGDGSVSPTGKITASTVSRQLADDLQELALKTGLAATEIKPAIPGGSFKNSKPLFRLCFYRGRNSSPRIGWTKEARQNQVSLEPYNGIVHCATVPNGTLYVRRNGKPMWSGNSPFEHCSVSIRVTAPIFVVREWHRHRTQSFNEVSGRYTELLPKFYAPNFDRPLIQVGKPGAYRFEVPEDDAMYISLWKDLRSNSQSCWDIYERLLDEGVAKEVARIVLPVNIYTGWYATGNLRAWINFLSLRAEGQAMYEIRTLACDLENILKNLFPETLSAWDQNGRGPL